MSRTRQHASSSVSERWRECSRRRRTHHRRRGVPQPRRLLRGAALLQWQTSSLSPRRGSRSSAVARLAWAAERAGSGRVPDYAGPAGGNSDSEGGDAPHVGIKRQRRCWLRSCRRRRRQDGEFGPDGQVAPPEWSWRWRCRVGHGRPVVYVCKHRTPRAARLTIHLKS